MKQFKITGNEWSTRAFLSTTLDGLEHMQQVARGVKAMTMMVK
jgi:hypothetical protein